MPVNSTRGASSGAQEWAANAHPGNVIYGGSMSNPSSEIVNELERARNRLEILQELELLESEFRLIKNEYTQRKQHLAERLNSI